MAHVEAERATEARNWREAIWRRAVREAIILCGIRSVCVDEGMWEILLVDLRRADGKVRLSMHRHCGDFISCGDL